MTKEEIKIKIKKLFALSDSPNPHESALAMERARLLLEKYRITQEDLNLSEQDRSIVHFETVEHYESKDWLMVLLKAIEVNNDVVCVLRKKPDDKVSVNFMADEAAVIVSVEMFKYLFNAVSKKALQEFEGMKAARFNITDRSIDVYKRGFAHGVWQQIMFEKYQREEKIREKEKRGECTDLVPVEYLKMKQRIEEALVNRTKPFDEYTKSPINSISDSLMASKGYFYGSRISLRKQIEANKNESDLLS